MKEFFKGFKEFAMRGNVIDMAVGVIIAGAFSAIVNSLVEDIISPFIGAITGQNFADKTFEVAGVTVGYGSFLMAVVNFIIIAFVLFCIIKAITKAKARAEALVIKENKSEDPTKKICPFCKTEIHIEATRCPHCTSELKTRELDA
ncbi:MAG: large conductance mechanosensitive channel protein MscL [Clostridia bacterium]|nr:large conductance mechanosensitive channel protein MscL [Clostridia bacterium]